MRVDGAYNGTTRFAQTISTDLFEYGFSLLRASLELKERNGNAILVQTGFELAARSFESLLTNSKKDDRDAGFIQIIGACCSHLAGFSAIAFSILSNHEPANNNQAEIAVRFLILRDLRRLRDFIADTLNDVASSDDQISVGLRREELPFDEALSKIANVSICRAIAFFDFALQTGNRQHVEGAKVILEKVISLTDQTGYVTLWWLARLTRHLIDDLWEHSLHQCLPINAPVGGETLYKNLRKKFILTLFNRNVSEVELWPSQMEAARRSTDTTDDLVVALPTSAGKTRIAEIAALVSLSAEKRIIIVTPLRALSAQTERSFKKTFVPLGYSVSSLYGAIGMSASDQDALKDKSIVIATPEKLDFALRNDPSILDDVGLLILDEGHMIGPTEREIRYEILVQRLLRRSDADDRRIVCLSAILPDGQPLDNFTQWLRSDVPGTAVKLPWRPTRQRFGILTWAGDEATLNFDYKSDIPFLKGFLTLANAIKPERSKRPRDLNEKTIFAAWKFADQGKRTLIFVTQANWVEKFGSNALSLVERGYLPSLLENRADVEKAIAVGEEWLGKNHPAVKALEVGMAVHHGGLPNPFLRELELLLSKGIIKVTVASPTLSQGLNINAAVLLVPYLVRSGTPITGEEFANVAGRAGRAFVDMEGFVIHIIEDQIQYRIRAWRKLITSARERNLSSGLFQVIARIYDKLAEQSDVTKNSSFEYLASNRKAWLANDAVKTEEGDEDFESLEFLVEKLDATVFGLISALDSDDAELPTLLEDALKGSLWARQVAVMAKDTKKVHMAILLSRAKLIWSSTTAEVRRGHFAMGVGFDTGLVIDQNADELGRLIDKADEAAINGNVSILTRTLIELVERLLVLRPFLPKKALPIGWKSCLVDWVSGKDIESIGSDLIPFIEDVFAYKMIWALEAVRMRRIARGWEPEMSSDAAAACLENGVPKFMMAMLIRAGLPSRVAAIKAVVDGEGNFIDGQGMSIWLRGRKVASLHKIETWPTKATRDIWISFYSEFFGDTTGGEWVLEEKKVDLNKNNPTKLHDGEYRVSIDDNTASFFTPDFNLVSKIKLKFKEPRPGIMCATVKSADSAIYLERFGAGEFEDM